MEFARIAVFVFAVEIIDPISHIACLLDLGQETTCADTVYSSCRQKEYITGLHGILIQCIRNGVVLNHLSIFIRSQLFLQSRTQMCRTMSIIDNVPHLGFSHRMMPFHRQLIIGMYLNGKIVAGINKLYQQRESITKALVVLLPYQLLFVFLHQFSQVKTLIFTVGYNRFITRDIRDFPALSHLFLTDGQVLKRYNLISTPNSRFQNRIKLIWIHTFKFYSVDKGTTCLHAVVTKR